MIKMKKEQVTIMKLGFCQYSNFNDHLDKGLESLTTKLDELKQKGATLQTVHYSIVVEGERKEGKCSCSRLGDCLNKEIRKAVVKLEEKNPALSTINYDIVMVGS